MAAVKSGEDTRNPLVGYTGNSFRDTRLLRGSIEVGAPGGAQSTQSTDVCDLFGGVP